MVGPDTALPFAGWGGMLALTALAAASEEQRAQVQSITLTATPPSYHQLVTDRQERVCDHLFAHSYALPCKVPPV